MQDDRAMASAYNDSRMERTSHLGGPCLVAWARLLIWAMRNADQSAKHGLRGYASSGTSQMTTMAASEPGAL
jgi:hypothetical protein